MSFDMEMEDYIEDEIIKKRSKRCLVTGGVGFVGTNLIKRLLKDGHEVISFDNYSTGFKENEQDGCEYLLFDIVDGEYFKNIDKEFDVIFHMAALPRIGPSFSNPGEVFKTNVLGTQNVLEYARKNNTPVIYSVNGKVKNSVRCMREYMDWL